MNIGVTLEGPFKPEHYRYYTGAQAFHRLVRKSAVAHARRIFAFKGNISETAGTIPFSNRFVTDSNQGGYKMTLNTLKCTVAAIALSAGSAFAASDTEVSTTAATDSAIENTGEVIKQGASSAAEATGNAMDSTAQAAGNAAEAVEEMVDSAVTETGNALDAAADATGDAIGDAATAAEELADDATEAVGNTVESANDALADDADAVVTGVMVSKAEFVGLTVGDIVGQNVYASTGEDVGEIDYIMTEAGRLSAIVGVGGFLGLGEHHVAIPLEDFTIAEGDLDGLVLGDWTEEMLRALPEVDQSSVETLEADVRLTAGN